MITRAQWESLNDKAKWDIKVALRGPDSYYGETLKWFTTSVIRGHVRKVFRVGGTVNKDLNLVILPDNDSDRTATKEKWNASHFTGHITSAAEWLNIPILHIPAKEWHTIMKSNSISSAASAIISLFTEDDEDSPNIKELQRHLKECILKGGAYY